MSALPRADRVGGFESRCFSSGLVLLILALLLIFLAPPAARAQTAPTVISITPTNGAVDVPTNSTIVFVFDQDMNRATIIESKPGAWSGNFEITPTNINVTGTWGTDKRTLTLKAFSGWPHQTNITWTLNPPTNGAQVVYPQIAGTNKVPVTTISGGFTTAGPPPPPPTIISVSPTNRAVNVAPLSPLVFTFDQDMDTNVVVAADTSNTANCGFSPSGSYSNAVWSADRRTLTFPSVRQLLLGAVVSWDLNPTVAALPVRNLAGEPLAFTTGSFTVQTNTGGNPAEICQPTTSTLGHYTIIQTFQTNQQVSANSVVPLTNSRPTFISLAKDPPGDKGFAPPGTVTNGSLTLPDGTVLPFTNLGRIVVDLGVYYTNTTDAEVTTAFPPGDYVMRLVQLSNVVSTITMTLPGAPPIPMIANYDAAQAIDAGNDFVLQWNSLPATSPGPFIQLAIYDSFGKLIFAAPNPCVSRTLDPGATSMLIPANTFRPGVVYNGMLEFGYRFYYETNAVPQMVGDGIVGGTTTFQLRTSLAANTASAPPTFSTTTLSFSGQPVITFHGAPGASYTIQRTHDVFTALRGIIGPATWTTAGSVATDGSGNGSFTDTTATLPAFYRIVGQ